MDELSELFLTLQDDYLRANTISRTVEHTSNSEGTLILVMQEMCGEIFSARFSLKKQGKGLFDFSSVIIPEGVCTEYTYSQSCMTRDEILSIARKMVYQAIEYGILCGESKVLQDV